LLAASAAAQPANEGVQEKAPQDNMVKIPAGEYMMGATDEDLAKYEKFATIAKKDSAIVRAVYAIHIPRHLVKVGEFYLSKFAVTRGEFSVFAKDTGFHGAGCLTVKNGKLTLDPLADWENPGFPQTSDDPVVCVSWEDANQYIAWLNSKIMAKNEHKYYHYRLPSEEEWEYAARAGTTGSVYWAGGDEMLCRNANVRDLSTEEFFGTKHSPFVNCTDGFATTAPVGSFPPNPWGLFDMLGNVEQWISSCPSDYSHPINDIYAIMCLKKKVVRGANWQMEPLIISSATRGATYKDSRNSALGFRLAADLVHDE
jgi:formylglycine-generating enzyme required for sulfatase activity